MKSDLPTSLVLRWITLQNLESSLTCYTFTTGKLQSLDLSFGMFLLIRLNIIEVHFEDHDSLVFLLTFT